MRRKNSTLWNSTQMSSPSLQKDCGITSAGAEETASLETSIEDLRSAESSSYLNR